jgi:uncharacterized protein (DUF1810 family)
MTTNNNDPFDLNRFLTAQERVYRTALAELKNGRKRSHWMWYVFPQIDGLAKSATSKRYAIKSIEEARQYLNHPVLGSRLAECAEAVLAVEGRSIFWRSARATSLSLNLPGRATSEIMGYPDDLKLKSSMTLFASLPEAPAAFAGILDKYFQGERDVNTLNILETRS